jgi:hypothetical protein
MDDITRALRDAWKRIGPSLRSNPTELNKRLARLDSVQLQSPPRAWCFAIRASDTRLAQFLERDVTDTHAAHDIHLTTRDLEQLAAPVRLPRGGARVTDVARELGTTRRGLLDARLNGTFTTRHVAGLGGVGGKPRPILSTDRPLDRAARSFALADRAWSITAAHAPGRIPPGLRVTLTRVPHMHSRTPRDTDRDPRDLHPEHPLNDPPAPRGKSKRLPPPQKDYVWYKWKGDDFVGYDWRASNPDIAGQHFKHQRDIAQIRERQRKHRAEHPKPWRGAGSEQFRGWRWLCPRCGRKVNLLFLPLPRVHLLGAVNLKKPGARSQEPVGGERETGRYGEGETKRATNLLSPLPGRERVRVRVGRGGSDRADCETSFACEKCHKIRRVSRCDPNAWNEIVTYLSAGLLYGREVERPAWFPKGQRADRFLETRGGAAALPGGLSCDGDEVLLPSSSTGRKIKYTPRPTRAPSARVPQIERMLLAGMSFQDIAKTLSLSKGTILWHAQQVYKHHGVRTLVELARKLNHLELVEGHRGSQTPEIRRRLLAGETVKEINTALNCGLTMIYNQRQHLRKQGVILRDARAANGGRRQALSYD